MFICVFRFIILCLVMCVYVYMYACEEVKFRPGTDTNDYDVKMRNVYKFLANGDKVKITLRFRGREMAHLNLGRELLERVAEDVKDSGKVENMPKMEGRQMIMMIGPLPK